MNVTAWKGKVAIVTGGGSGIGKELAMQMAGAGAKVMVTDINGASAKQVAAWVIGRLFPGLVTKLSADAVALERKDRK